MARKISVSLSYCDLCDNGYPSDERNIAFVKQLPEGQKCVSLCNKCYGYLGESPDRIADEIMSRRGLTAQAVFRRLNSGF